MEPQIYSILPDGRLYHSYLVDTVQLSPSKQPVTLSVSPNVSQRNLVLNEVHMSPQKLHLQSSPMRCQQSNIPVTKMNAVQLQQVPNSLYLFPQPSTVNNSNLNRNFNGNYVQNLVNEIHSGNTSFDRIHLEKLDNSMGSIELNDELKNRFIKEMDDIIDSYKDNSTFTYRSTQNESFESYQRVHKDSETSFISRPSHVSHTTSHTPNRQSILTKQFPEDNILECIAMAIFGIDQTPNFKHHNSNDVVSLAKSLIITKAGADNIEIRNAKGQLTYGGGYFNNNLNGFGILINPFKVFKMHNIKNFNTVSKTWDSYEGYFHEGRFHGKGTIIINGDRLMGEFHDGVLNSNAILEMSDGSRFTGFWRDNVLEE